MFLELQASLVQSHLQASERVPCSNTSNITLEYTERERERNSVLCDNVVFDIDARHSATLCILTFKQSHLARRFLSGDSFALACKTEAKLL